MFVSWTKRFVYLVESLPFVEEFLIRKEEDVLSIEAFSPSYTVEMRIPSSLLQPVESAEHTQLRSFVGRIQARRLRSSLHFLSPVPFYIKIKESVIEFTQQCVRSFSRFDASSEEHIEYAGTPIARVLLRDLFVLRAFKDRIELRTSLNCVEFLVRDGSSRTKYVVREDRMEREMPVASLFDVKVSKRVFYRVCSLSKVISRAESAMISLLDTEVLVIQIVIKVERRDLLVEYVFYPQLEPE